MILIPKNPPIRSKARLAQVGKIKWCVLCGSTDWLENAHLDEGKGIGQKTSDLETARLCRKCHHEIGNGKKYDNETRRRLMRQAIDATNRAIQQSTE